MYYVYKVTNTINNKIYIGVHKSNDIKNDNYIGTGGSHYSNAKKKYGIENFEREILFEYADKNSAYNKEAEIVNKEFIANDMHYNKNLGGEGSWEYVNSLGLPNCMHNPIVAKKVSDKTKGRKRSGDNLIAAQKNAKAGSDARRGMKDSIETNIQRAESLKEYYKTNDSARKGITLSNKEKQKIKDGWTEEKRKKKSEQQKEYIKLNPDAVKGALGCKHSKESKIKHSIAQKELWKERKQIQGECPHCKTTGVLHNLKRWHFDNCRNKIQNELK